MREKHTKTLASPIMNDNETEKMHTLEQDMLDTITEDEWEEFETLGLEEGEEPCSIV